MSSHGSTTLLLLLLAAAPAFAETRKTIPVSADVVAGCLVAVNGTGSWGRIDLGTVSGVGSGDVSAGLVSTVGGGIAIECTPGVQLSVTANDGAHAAGGARQLAHTADAAARIPYQLFADGSTTPWTTQAIAIAFPVGTAKRLLPVIGTATLGDSQRAGTYRDTVQVTLSF